jgi:hypothetical protein
MAFQKATKQKAKGRFALFGPAGSGKSYSSLALGAYIAKQAGGKMAAIDTERGSLSKYADLFDFDVMELETFAPQEYTKAIREASAAGYSVLVIDSLSHAWMGKGGALEQVDNAAKRQRQGGGGNSFTAWKDITPIQNEMVDTILGAPMHVIVTMRTKTEYVLETVNGKQVPRKIGLQPVQRDGMEYEFDVVGDMDADNNLLVTKSRCPAVAGKVFGKPGEDLGGMLWKWLTTGAERKPEAPKATEPEADDPLPPAHPLRDYEGFERAARDAALGRGITPAEFEANWPAMLKKMGGGETLPVALRDRVVAGIAAGKSDHWKTPPAPQPAPDDAAQPPAADEPDASTPGEPPEMTAATLAVMSERDFATLIYAAADDAALAEPQVKHGLMKFANGKGKSVKSLTGPDKLELFKAVEARAFDWTTGQVREPAAAGA